LDLHATFFFKKNDTNAQLVNELSNTIDLESTLIRAESLFRKFQRLVETIDKKQNFPGPRLLRQSTASSSSASAAAAVTPQSPPPAPATGSGGSPRREHGKSAEKVEKVITPELRQLLSRKVEVLPRKEVARQGDGLWMHEGK